MQIYHLLILLTSLTTAYTMAMEDYQLDLAKIKTMQRQYIGKYGWTVNTGDGKKCVAIITSDDRTEFIEKIKVARKFKEYQNTQFLLQHNYTNKSIISDDNDVHIIDMQTGDAQITLSGHTKPVQCCTKTDYLDILATGSDDKTIKIWNTKKQQCLHTLQGHTNYVAQVTAEGNTLFSTDWEPCLKVWDITSGKQFITKTLIDKNNKFHSPMSLMMHNHLIYIGATTGKITIVDPRTVLALSDWTAHESTVNCIIPCKNSNLLYSGSEDQTIKQWDIRNVNSPIKTLHKKNDPTIANFNIHNVYEDHDGKKIFSSDMDTIYVWDISKEKPKLITKKSMKHPITPNCMHMNNDETELYIGTKEGIKTVTPTLNFNQLAALAEQK